MKKILLVLMLIVVIVVGVTQAPRVNILHDGSDGRVESISMASLVGLGRAVSIMREAAAENVGTVRMVSPGGEFFLLAAYRYGAWNFAMLNGMGRAVDASRLAIAQCGDCFTFTALMKFLLNQKWKVITAAELPQAIKTILLNGSMVSTIAAFANSTLTTILVIPVMPGELYAIPTPALQ